MSLHLEGFIEITKDRQAEITEVVRDIAALVHKQFLLSQCHQSDFVTRSSTNPVVSVAPLPPLLQDHITESLSSSNTIWSPCFLRVTSNICTPIFLDRSGMLIMITNTLSGAPSTISSANNLIQTTRGLLMSPVEDPSSTSQGTAIQRTSEDNSRQKRALKDQDETKRKVCPQETQVQDHETLYRPCNHRINHQHRNLSHRLFDSNGARLSEPRALDFDKDNEDVDIEDTDEVEVEFSNIKTGQEPSRARLKSLQALLRMLIQSPNIAEDVDANWVKKSGFKDNDFTMECRTVALLSNILRPYLPKLQSKQSDLETPAAHIILKYPSSSKQTLC
ncbi:hypothetical protein BGZ65_010180 [Modicella reniformis]|uniref:Uncharacterized protein n=1 Tax=Modicella reniformis TaxID=1440133 RepID=A0A9P6ISX1_9FUNG|nr:hypothetical protein BGZ65_010180 [Modicella reniformis]